MLRRSPPLESIEIFVAAAHGESFRSVARNLALSPSAVSRRIASLEGFLGITLFDRSGPVSTLNSAGAHYLAMVEPAMNAIRRATTMVAEKNAKKLKVATSHSFAASWLMPRLAQLHDAEGILVDIVPSRHFDALRSGEAQLGIWGGLGVPDDMIAEIIADAEFVPVAAPRLVKQSAADGPPDLATQTLLSVQSPASLWDRWFASHDRPQRQLEIREFATLQLMYEAAAAGLGVALAVPMVAEPYLTTGRLVPYLHEGRRLGESYRLYRPRRRILPGGPEDQFSIWLRQNIEMSLAQFRLMTSSPSTQ